MKVAIVGCGLIGRKRAAALVEIFREHGGSFGGFCDADAERAHSLACEFGSVALSFEEILCDVDITGVVLATTHDVLAGMSLRAILAGKHVLVEKPAARSPRELEPVIAAAKDAGVYFHVGFNHRYHPAIELAHQIADSGEIGPLTHVRAVYGHGGRPGYEKEWRMQKEKSGGGELIDQGMHLIDLSRLFLGNLRLHSAITTTAFWTQGLDSPAEDNAFALLRGDSGRVAQIHASWTEWKNRFQFDVFGKMGKLEVSGIGGSYGTETLTLYRMDASLQPPSAQSWQWLRPDSSWLRETRDWASGIADPVLRTRSGQDALAALRIVEDVYASTGSVFRENPPNP
jgi:predicted dehydrogenase